MPLHILVNTQRRCSLATQRLSLLPVRFEEMEDLNGCVRCLTRRSLRAFQKKLEPFLPNSFRAHPLKQIIVALPMSLEVNRISMRSSARSFLDAESEIRGSSPGRSGVHCGDFIGVDRPSHTNRLPILVAVSPTGALH